MNEQIKYLQARADDILQLNAAWKSCQDGSYEMSLSHAGYHKIMDQIKALERQQQPTYYDAEGGSMSNGIGCSYF